MIFLILIIHAINAYNLTGYPPIDVIPPINVSMSNIFLHNISIPPPGGQNFNYSKDITNCTDNKAWGLTFDDGPSLLTLDLLKELSDRNMKATFFVIGSMVLQYPKVLIETFKAGHEIGIHTWSHPSLLDLTNDQIIVEIMWTARIIREVIGFTPKIVRPPYGDIDERVRTILKAMGLEIVIWNRDTLDWKQLSAGRKLNNSTKSQDLFSEWLKEPQSGTISLQHDIINKTVMETPFAMDLLKNSSYNTVLVSQCASINIPYDDTIILKTGTITNTAIKVDPITNNSVNETTHRTTVVHSSKGSMLSQSVLMIPLLYLIIFV